MKFFQNNPRDYHRRQQKPACQRKKQRARKKVRNRHRQEERKLLVRFRKTSDPHFPDVYEKIAAIPDCRHQEKYSLLEVITS